MPPGPYSSLRVKYDASRRAIVRFEALNTGTSSWESIDVEPERQSKLTDYGIRVACGELKDALGPCLPAPTGLDDLVGLAGVLIAPQTLIPKVVGKFVQHLVAVAAPHLAALCPVISALAGQAAEQAIAPLCEPGEAVEAMDDFDVVVDLETGCITPVVADWAVDGLKNLIEKHPR